MATAAHGIHIGVDLGTGTIKVSGTYRMDGRYMISRDVLLIQNQRMVPAVVAYYGTPQKFYWGQDLLDMVSRGEIPAGKVIQHHKLALYEGFAKPGTSSIKDHVMQQLSVAGVLLEEMYAELITHVVAAVRERMCQTQLGHIRPKAEILKAPISARITLPQSFGPGAARTLRTAAAKAGVSIVNIASEQICAMAAYLDNMTGPSPFSEGDAFLLVDAGCGTVDIVLYIHRGGQGADITFAAVAQSCGSLFGSLQVDKLIQQMINDAAPGGIQSYHTKLNITPDDFSFQLLSGIEEAKKKFNPHRPHNHLAWQATITNYATGNYHTIPITHGMVREAFGIVFRENFKDVDALIKKYADYAKKNIEDARSNNLPRVVNFWTAKQSLPYIVLSGGGGQCAYMKEMYEKRYEKLGISIISVADQMNGEATHVAKGALSSRYPSIDVQDLPFRFSYAFLQDETFNHDRHPDCWDRETNIRGYRVVNRKKVRRYIPGAPAKDRIVIDRLTFFGHKGQTPRRSRSIPMEFMPTVDNPVVEVTAVATELDHLKDHDAALDDDHDVTKHDNKLREGVLPWTKGKWTLDDQFMRRGGWKIAKDDFTGELRYQRVVGSFSIRRTDEKNMIVDLHLRLPDANGDTQPDGKLVKVEGTFKLYDSSLGEFVSDGDAGR